LLFVAVALVDLVHSLREEPAPWPHLLADHPLRFEWREPVVDFRAGARRTEVEMLPVADFDPSRWKPAGTAGRWVPDDGAGFEISLTRGGHRTMVVECRAAAGVRGARRLGVAVNGVSCGSVEVDDGWSRRILRLPEGAVRRGINTIMLELPDRPPIARRGRTLLVRRLGLFYGDDVDGDALQRGRAVVVDHEAGRVSIRASGTFSTVFSPDDRVDALTTSYRFTSASGRAEVVVARPEGNGHGFDAAMRRRLAASDLAAGELRFPLHGRRGMFCFRAEVELGPQEGRFDLISPSLVSEGAPTAAPDRRQPRWPE
jgi:hypothetical protein